MSKHEKVEKKKQRKFFLPTFSTFSFNHFSFLFSIFKQTLKNSITLIGWAYTILFSELFPEFLYNYFFDYFKISRNTYKLTYIPKLYLKWAFDTFFITPNYFLAHTKLGCVWNFGKKKEKREKWLKREMREKVRENFREKLN